MKPGVIPTDEYAGQLGPSEYEAPSNTWEELVIRRAVVSNTMTKAEIRRFVAPPLPQVGAVKPSQVHHETPSITNILANELSDPYINRQGWYSGGPAGYSGSPRNMFGGPL